VDLPAAFGDKVVELTCNDDDPAAANSNVFDDPPVCVGGDQVDLPALSDDSLVEPTCNDDDPVDVPAEAAAANSDVFDDPVCVSVDQVNLRKNGDLVDISCQAANKYDDTKQSVRKLRNNEVSLNKIQAVITLMASDGERHSLVESSEDEFRPEAHRPRVCDVNGCQEDIFIACLQCPSFICYDHIDTGCADHRAVQRTLDQPQESSSSDDVTNKEAARSRSKKRRRHYKTTRQHKSRPENWKKNIRKLARLSGQEYESVSGEIKRAKRVSLTDCNHGKQQVFRCSEFSDVLREQLHSEYYASGDYSRQRDFLCKYVHRYSSNKGVRKSNVLQYTLPLSPAVTKRVCKKMFLRTLDISERVVLYTLDRVAKAGGIVFSIQDLRGRHKPHNKTSDVLVESVRRHINSFPKMDPHYTRADTNRQFLGPELNITRMYNLYRDKCVEEHCEYVSESLYRRVFCNDFNLSFHCPKKDACLKCEKYNLATPEERDGLLQDFEEHIARKTRAREEKEADKARAAIDKTWHVITADLQSVLTTPCSNVSALYYARKLAVYNFTIYNQSNGDGYCFIWDETKGHRGANEIGSLLYIYLKECLPPDAKHIVITSDSTVAQNRNQYVTAMLLLAAQILPNIEIIEQKFLEPGHTQMEVDSIHATIDSARKNVKVNEPAEWPMLIQMARRRNPYHVREIQRNEFYDLHGLSSLLGTTSLKKDVDGQQVNWMKIKCIRVTKGKTDEIEIKESYDEEYRKVKHKIRKTRLSRVVIDASMLHGAYADDLLVSVAKKTDLIKLCETGAIPSKSHAFYHSLQTSSSVRDCLPEPDFTEDQDG